MNQVQDSWNQGDPYEYFMGRWSRLVAHEFLLWLKIAPHSFCLEVGCGTGALSETIYEYFRPEQFWAIDPSPGFIAKAKERLKGKGNFVVGNVAKLPFENGYFDLVVSGLALNFFPDLIAALYEMKRVSKKNGNIVAYVWDYSGRMDMLRYFWDAASSIDHNSRLLDEGVRFPICNSDTLSKEFKQAGISEVETTMLDVETKFESFDDYWTPFLGGQGPAPSYVASLSEEMQADLKDQVFNSLPIESDGSIKLLARAIAIRGRV
ncbi:MAG: class I SAM-dependent methyltransferase [Saprospiraceae bacterium]|nr:class I SAM-dependent methyltransferase [Saprospiraceae bacterium]